MRVGDMAYEVEYLIISSLGGAVPLWYLINRLPDVNHKIQRIGTELQEITMNYKFGGLKVEKCFRAQPSLQAAKTNMEVDDITIGFEDKVVHILEQLVEGTQRLQVISIFGMPGLGKTTLAKKIYNHPSIDYKFDRLSWCVVSQKYQNQSIMTNILIHINPELDRDSIFKMKEADLLEHIYKTLKGRRYLIVMDDIWDSNIWDELLRCFPNDGNGSRILFTTRNKDVAPPNSIIYALSSLTNDQCWELLEKKVFDNQPCPPELREIGKEIAANCSGLPLAVVVVAGILSSMGKEESTWEEVGENLASYIFYGGENSSVMQILELSYKHLPEHLRPCYLYIAAFRKDEEIPIRKLRRLWIAEGLIHQKEGKSAENVAEEYLMELIDKSLVMIAKRSSDGGVKACVIHDLLHDLCFKICEEENFPKSFKYFTYKAGHNLQASQPARDTILLRVLNFDYYNCRFIGIELLLNLRYLVIDYLSASIGSLVNLEYLLVRAHPMYGRISIPPSILKIRKLRCIQVDSEVIYDKDCTSSQTNNLEFLSDVNIREPKDEEMLKCSPHLRKLKCRCGPILQANGEFRYTDLCFFAQLESLNVTFHGFKIEFSIPSNIRKQTLSSSGLPWKKMSIIGRLENLEVLKLGYNAFVGKRWDTRDDEFQKLKFLKLDRILYLTQWNIKSSEHFPRLQQLVLRDCMNLQEIPCEIRELTTLQLIEVKGRCPYSLVESAERVQQEQLDLGNEELRVIIR